MIWTRHGGEIVDGPADDASLNRPFAMVDAGGGDFYLTDLGDHAIRRYDAARARVDTIAGDGRKGFTGDGLVYVSDFGNQRIRALNPTARRVRVGAVSIAPGTIETIARLPGASWPSISRPASRRRSPISPRRRHSRPRTWRCPTATCSRRTTTEARST
jgi:hypothetical protein